jgi:hypothetical protein
VKIAVQGAFSTVWEDIDHWMRNETATHTAAREQDLKFMRDKMADDRTRQDAMYNKTAVAVLQRLEEPLLVHFYFNSN